MNAERWERVAHVYHAALEREPSERESYVKDASGDDLDLRREVTSLLAQEDAVGPLDRPMLQAAADVLEPEVDLPAGSRLGPYEIEELLGVGGMGQVYRARDTRLGRSVALKLLPSDVEADVGRLTRFQREAQLLASLNHPHIGAIYGIEEGQLSLPGDVGQPVVHAHALVLELVEGPTLAERIARGPIPVDDALVIATQIAEALQAAHQEGIVHRDLKPANIKLRADGTVKVLDFGLAKLVDRARETDDDAAGKTPTPASPAVVTAAGVIIGTAAYMSPEQAKGTPADKRSDIWSFGCVLYEMLAGRRAFDGEAVADVLAALLRTEPDWSLLHADTPRPIRSLLQRCLVKDRRLRLADMSVALYLLGEAHGSSNTPDVAATAVRPRRIRYIAVGLGFLAGLLVAAAGSWMLVRTRRAEPLRPVRFEWVTPAAHPLVPDSLGTPVRELAVSPDGTRIVYRAGGGRQAHLVVRALNELEPKALTGTSGANHPFFSSDGRSIGFASFARLKTISVQGGSAIDVCALGSPERGATSGPDNTIIFATADRATGLLHVSAAGGGTPTVLTTPDSSHGELDHWFPESLPDNRGVLFTIVRERPDENEIAVLDLQTGQHRVLIRGGSEAQYVNSGHLVYAAAGGIRAVRFDLAALKVVSDPIPIVERVATTSDGVAQFAVSPVGTLVYVPSDAPALSEPQRLLVWVDRDEREQSLGTSTPRRAFAAARLSPDGMRIAVDIGVTEHAIWIWDMRRETLTRLNGTPGSERQPVWTPDGRRIIFWSERGGSPNLYWQAADGRGTAEALFPTPLAQFPYSVSPDGTQLFLAQGTGANTGTDVGALVLQGRRRTVLLVQTPAREFGAEVSPDGRWLAYQSDESGEYQVYVRPLPDVNTGRWQISDNGGTRPAWARNARELYYFDAEKRLTAVSIEGDGSTIVAGKPKTLLEAKYVTDVDAYERPYDVAADGRFLMIKDDPSVPGRMAGASLVVVDNWLDELKRVVPVR